MYTILVNEDNSIVTSVKTVIMQRSSLVDNIQILVPAQYNGTALKGTTVTMEYILPVSKAYRTTTLSLQTDRYSGTYPLQYMIKGSTSITAEPGDIEFQLTFTSVIKNSDGSFNQFVRKTKPGIITITPITEWSNIIPDEALTALDQRIIMLDALANEINALNQEVYNKSVDDIKLDKATNEIYLTSKAQKVGTPVNVGDITEIVKESLVGNDLDGHEDGVVYVDEIPPQNTQNTQKERMVSLDDLV